MTDDKILSRSEFLKMAWVGLVSLGTLSGFAVFVRYLSYQPPAEQKAPVDLGEAGSYPPGSITMLPEIPVLLLHTPGGFTVLDTTCTHLGCQLHLEGAGLVCPCHGSQFDLEGEPTQGPATLPLTHWRVEETEAGHLILVWDEVAPEK